METVPSHNLLSDRSFLSGVFANFPVGLAVCDRRLRFELVNESLAAMNGLPPAAHIDKTIYKVLGNAAQMIQPVFERVFASGHAVSGVYLKARLPTRSEVGHWLETYFPIRNHAGQVQQVGVIVLEITEAIRLQEAAKRLESKLVKADAVIKSATPCGAPGCFTPVVQRYISQASAIAACLSQGLLTAAAVAAARRGSFHHDPGIGVQPFVSAPPSNGPGSRLSDRELEVLLLVARGKSNKETASILNISVRTVETYRARLMLKLGFHSICQVVRYAVHNGLI